MLQQEKEYYRSGNVLVTNARAEMGGRTFAMANVTAVSMATTIPSATGATFLIVIGIIAILLGLSDLSKDSIGGLVVGLVATGVGFSWMISMKPSYSVNIASASGESRAMASWNRDEIAQVVEAIKRAMIERG